MQNESSESRQSAGQTSSSPPRRKVVITTEEHEVNDQVLEALANEPNLYQRAGALVTVQNLGGKSDNRQCVRSCVEIPQICELPRATLRETMTRVVEFQEIRGNGDKASLVSTHPPDWVVSAIHARQDWPGIKYLESVLPYPVVLHDGEILNQNGYHASSKILVQLPDDLLIEVPDTPTKYDIAKAVETLLDVFVDFPFVDEHHRSAIIAGLLTPLAWFSFNGPAPWFLIDKNVRGAGAGLLADVLAIILTGDRFPVTTYTNDKEELRKRITTMAIQGERMIMFDNLAGPVGCDVLDAAMTGHRWKDRVLGGNRMYDGPLHVTWFGTGNNVQLQADTSRRVCHIRIESADERPELRGNFKYPDLRAHVKADRGRYLSAALTLLRAWFDAGKPRHNLKPWGSYEAWSGVVREVVVFAGLPDPGETRTALQTTADLDAEAMNVIINGLEKMDHNNRGITTSAIISRLKLIGENSPEWMVEMRRIVEEYCGKLEPKALSGKFRQFKHRNFSGKMLDIASQDRNHTSCWTVRSATTIRQQQVSPPTSKSLAINAGDAGNVGDIPTSDS